MKKQIIEMPIINLKAAGIDIGSRSHFATIGQGKRQLIKT